MGQEIIKHSYCNFHPENHWLKIQFIASLPHCLIINDKNVQLVPDTRSPAELTVWNRVEWRGFCFPCIAQHTN